jgi:hypothetical protein
MTPQDYEKAFMVMAVWQLAKSNDLNELAAIACTLRNHVVPRPGQMQTYKTYLHACEDFMKAYPVRPRPTLLEDAMTSYPDGLLAIIDKIYDCSYPDLTATQTTPGARYFCQASQPPEWIKPILSTHHLCGTFGSQQFWA